MSVLSSYLTPPLPPHSPPRAVSTLTSWPPLSSPQPVGPQSLCRCSSPGMLFPALQGVSFLWNMRACSPVAETYRGLLCSIRYSSL